MLLLLLQRRGPVGRSAWPNFIYYGGAATIHHWLAT